LIAFHREFLPNKHPGPNFIDFERRHHQPRGTGAVVATKEQQTREPQKNVNMNKCLILIVSIAIFYCIHGLCRAQSDAPYTEGPVWTITMVKAKAGMTDEYLKGLAKTFKGAMDEAKKQNLIMDYKILLGEPATPQDFEILLMVESKNMAALDGFREKADPIARKIEGTPDQQLATQTKRLEIREILGSKNMREITLK
jgi:hypothetical protein